jgi:hypothetical protein
MDSVENEASDCKALSSKPMDDQRSTVPCSTAAVTESLKPADVDQSMGPNEMNDSLHLILSNWSTGSSSACAVTSRTGFAGAESVGQGASWPALALTFCSKLKVTGSTLEPAGGS